MISELPIHDFLKSTDFQNNEFLNKLLDFVNSNSKVFGLDLTKQSVTKIPFTDGTDNPNAITVKNPTWIGYGGDVWLAVPQPNGTTKAYNITNILKSGVIRKINNVTGDSDANVNLLHFGDIDITNNTSTNSITIDSRVIDKKILDNSTLANKAILNAAAADLKADNAVNAANAAQGTATANELEINSLKPRVSKNESDIATLKNEVIVNTSAITAIGNEAVKTITSSDSSITVAKVGNNVDLKAVGGGGGTGTVKSVGGKSPKPNGDIPIEQDSTISEVTSTDPNSIRLKVNVSKAAGNAISINNDGLFSTGGSGGGPAPAAGVSTINSNQPVSNNYDIIPLDKSIVKSLFFIS